MSVNVELWNTLRVEEARYAALEDLYNAADTTREREALGAARSTQRGRRNAARGAVVIAAREGWIEKPGKEETLTEIKRLFQTALEIEELERERKNNDVARSTPTGAPLKRDPFPFAYQSERVMSRLHSPRAGYVFNPRAGYEQDADAYPHASGC